METSHNFRIHSLVMQNDLAMQKQLTDDGEVAVEEFRDFKEKIYIFTSNMTVCGRSENPSDPIRKNIVSQMEV